VCYTEKEEDDIRQFLCENDFDFVLCSIHHVNGWLVSDPDNGMKIEKKDQSKIIKEYFRLLKKAIKTGLFDVMSHIDLYKRVVPEPDFGAVRKQWEEVAELLVENDVGFEINTSYSIIVPDGIYPSVDVIKIMLEKGVKIVTMGSDAHLTEDVGRGLAKVEKMLDKFGVEMIYRFEKRKPIPINITASKIKVLEIVK
jgi:histidinol-phosphatase (PHP family)